MRYSLAAMLLGLTAGPAVAQTASPYAGQETRPIKALSGQEIADLAAGRGMGLAKAAELNSFPGPMHVLEAAERLGLAPGQRAAVEASRARMSAEASRLGAAILAEERALDAGFAQARITPAELSERTARIGTLQGRLRAVHLDAHIETRAILTPAQVTAYDELRGYSSSARPHGAHHSE